MGGHERKWLHGHAKWKNCKETVELSELKGLECTVGVDLSAKIDLTSISFEFKKDDKYIVLSHSFMPEDTLAEKRQTDKVPYDLWVQQNGLRQHLVRSLIMNILKHILEIWKRS